MIMIYTLSFTLHGKAYSNSQEVPGRYLNNQYEAVACGLLLGLIDEKGFSRQDVYTNLSLRENGEDNGTVTNNIVWVAERYIPISEEVK